MMMFKINESAILKVDDTTIAQMLLYRQDTSDKKEAGGLLMGKLLKDSAHIVIDKLTLPSKKDKRSRFSFFRHFFSHQNILEKVWGDSNKIYTYLGEWHTHPEDYPTPSQTDYKNWLKLLKTATFDSNYLFFIIIGIKEIRVWVGDRNTFTFKRLFKYESKI